MPASPFSSPPRTPRGDVAMSTRSSDPAAGFGAIPSSYERSNEQRSKRNAKAIADLRKELRAHDLSMKRGTNYPSGPHGYSRVRR